MIKQNQSGVRNIDFKIEPNKAENVFCFLLVLASFFEPIDQLQWGFLQNVALKMVHTVRKMKTEFDRLQTDFAWSQHIFFVSVQKGTISLIPKIVFHFTGVFPNSPPFPIKNKSRKICIAFLSCILFSYFQNLSLYWICLQKLNNSNKSTYSLNLLNMRYTFYIFLPDLQSVL